MQQFILIEGDPIDGFTFTGPFSAEEAEEVRNTYNRDGWVAPLDAPFDSTEDAEMADLDALDDELTPEVMADINAFNGTSMSLVDLIVKAEQGELESAVEYGAYIWLLVSSGLVDSTGSNQRAVADYAYTYGNTWQTIAQDNFMSTFNGARTVAEVRV